MKESGYLKSIFNPVVLILAVLIFGIQNNGYPQSGNELKKSIDTTLANTYLQLADSIINQQQPDKAIALVLKAKDIFEASENWTKYITCFNLLARYHDYNDDTKTSFEYLEKAQALAKRYLKTSNSTIANTFQQKAELFIQQDIQDSAVYYLEKANHIFLKEEDWEGYSWANILMVLSHYYQTNFTSMDSLLNVVYELDEVHHFPPESEIRETVLQWQQLLYKETGEYRKLFLVSKQTLDERLLRLNSSFDSIMLADNYHNLGTIYQTKGDYDEAIRYFQLALDIQLAISDDPKNIYEEYRHIGICLHEKKEANESLVYLKKSLEQLPGDQQSEYKAEFTKVYISIGRSHIENHQLDSAVYYLNKVLDMSTKDFDRGLCFLNLGLVFKEKKDFDNSIYYFTKAVSINETLYGTYHPTLVNLYQYLGEVYALKGEHLTALGFFQKTLRLLNKGLKLANHFDNPPLENVVDKLRFLKTLHQKGNTLLSLYKEKNDLEKVYSSFQLATILIENIKQDYQSEGAKLILSSQGHSIYETAIKIALILYDSTGNNDFLHDAFRHSEKSKALLLLESLKNSDYVKTYDNPSFDSLLQEIKSQKLDIVFYSQKLFEEQQKGKSNALKIKNWQAELIKVRSDYESLRHRLEKEFPDYYDLNFDLDVTTIETIQQSLLENSDAVFIEYFMGDTTLYTFVVTSSDFKVYQQIKTEKLDRFINTYLIQQSKNPALALAKDEPQHFVLYTNAAYNLYRYLLEPVLKFKNIDQLIIIPDGNLNYLSFDALLTEKAPSIPIDYSINHLQYLLEGHQISYAYSGTLLLESLKPRKNPAAKNYGGFAPVFNNNQQIAAERGCYNNQLGTLEYSEKSVQMALSLFGGQSFLHRKANKSNFINKAAEYRILHLSTHACVDDRDPMFNKIYFSDGYINTYELHQLQLHADLAVLSACETGLGQLVRGEGVFSLSRGFMQAGCPSVVTSLWNANDYATAEIIMAFHKNIKTGQTKDSALRNAKRAYLENSPSRLSAPYYWATFIGIGNMEAVHLNRAWSFKEFGIVGITILLLVFFFVKKRIRA